MRDGSVGSTPGWYPDPGGQHDLRYFNGADWTGDVSTDGERRFAPMPTTGGNGPSGTPALVLGIVAVCIAWIPFISVIGAGVAVAAIVTGVRRRRWPSARDAANVGIVTGVVGLVLAMVGTWLAVIVLREVDRFDDPGPHDVADVVCEEVDGVTRASGSITNLDDERRSYTIEITFDGDRSETALVDDVEPGETTSFVLDEDFRFDELSCSVTDVKGPYPFGIDTGL
ncbi:DUF2510 domain-containing protein [Ilumatobacter sp.]|uniref:DUF2510 domain-containing protein n=1 Tax=Ilumatobacter sp. TaxID=1967498 RepID=UPI003C3699A7